MSHLAILWVMPFCLALAALNDLIEMKIPNRIPAILVVVFLVFAPFVGLGWTEIGMNVVAGLAVFGFCFALFAFNVMGGGDAKLLTACALWFGLNPSLLAFLVAVGYVGGAVTLLILILRSQANTVMAIGVPLPASLVTATKIPYGIAIAIGGFLTFEQAPIYSLAINAIR